MAGNPLLRGLTFLLLRNLCALTPDPYNWTLPDYDVKLRMLTGFNANPIHQKQMAGHDSNCKLQQTGNNCCWAMPFQWETFEMLEISSSEHARAILSMRALFYACVQPVKAVEQDSSKVSHWIMFSSQIYQ